MRCNIKILTLDDIDALEKQFRSLGLQDSAIRGLRKAFGDTQTATISLPAEAAFKLLAAGEVKIGWVDRPLREQVTVTGQKYTENVGEKVMYSESARLNLYVCFARRRGRRLWAPCR